MARSTHKTSWGIPVYNGYARDMIEVRQGKLEYRMQKQSSVDVAEGFIHGLLCSSHGSFENGRPIQVNSYPKHQAMFPSWSWASAMDHAFELFHCFNVGCKIPGLTERLPCPDLAYDCEKLKYHTTVSIPQSTVTGQTLSFADSYHLHPGMMLSEDLETGGIVQITSFQVKWSMPLTPESRFEDELKMSINLQQVIVRGDVSPTKVRMSPYGGCHTLYWDPGAIDERPAIAERQ